jgi:hypothetical protein
LNQQELIFEQSPNGTGGKAKASGLDLDLKRVLARIIKYWYLLVLSLSIGLAIAYFVNRYSARIYPVRASIIILQNDENAGAKFLYKNELVNPFRNFYNEIYIMRSYPLLTGVMEELNFDVSYFREGNIKTMEYYDSNFPIELKVVGPRKLYGKSVNFKVVDDMHFSLEFLFEGADVKQKNAENLIFNDTININGYSFFVRKKGEVKALQNILFLVRFNDPYVLARSYSARLSAGWAQFRGES